MKLTSTTLLTALLAAGAMLAPVARAGTACPDDPERCVERGAAVPRTAGVVTGASRAPAVPAPAAVIASSRRAVPAPARKPASKPAPRVTPRPSTSAPATPGMGMLLKMSGGTGSDVTWFPSRPVDSSSASWVL